MAFPNFVFKATLSLQVNISKIVLSIPNHSRLPVILSPFLFAGKLSFLHFAAVELFAHIIVHQFFLKVNSHNHRFYISLSHLLCFVDLPPSLLLHKTVTLKVVLEISKGASVHTHILVIGRIRSSQSTRYGFRNLGSNHVSASY